ANIGLAEAIVAAGGALVSEQPPEVATSARYLVARNRLQSGLAAAVIAVESGREGGTMQTTRFARQQERRLFVPVDASGRNPSAIDALLSAPARELPELLPAWSTAKGLARRLGEERAAEAVSRATLPAFLAACLGASRRPWPLPSSNGRERSASRSGALHT